jgi:predicted nucleotidyltransferase
MLLLQGLQDPGQRGRHIGNNDPGTVLLTDIPKLGMIIPNMGISRKPTRKRRSRRLADALFTPGLQRVLGPLFGQPDREFMTAELIELAGSGTGGSHRVLQRLAESGLVRVRTQGRQKYYQANPTAPIFDELTGLIHKTIGVVGQLRNALEPLADQITAAFVYGSVADRSDKAGSDVDLMVISDTLSYPDLYARLQVAEKRLGRPVNPNLLSTAEYRARRGQPDGFVARLEQRPREFLFGSDDVLR